MCLPSLFLQVFVWGTPRTKGTVTALLQNYNATGCPAVLMASLSAARIQCAGRWNDNLTPAQLAAHKVSSKPLLMAKHGWDKAKGKKLKAKLEGRH